MCVLIPSFYQSLNQLATYLRETKPARDGGVVRNDADPHACSSLAWSTAAESEYMPIGIDAHTSQRSSQLIRSNTHVHTAQKHTTHETLIFCYQ